MTGKPGNSGHSDSDSQTQSIIDQLTSTSDPQLVKSLYRQWAATYNDDLAEHGYVAPNLAVEEFVQQLPVPQPLILDAGCGTGIVGELLRDKGQLNIHGADFSSDMLDQARLTEVYLKLAMADFSDTLDLDDNTYDAVISVGVYTSRFEGRFIGEMLRILKPGGLLYFTCRPHYFHADAATELHQYLQAGRLNSLSMELKPYMLKQNAKAWYIAVTTASNSAAAS
ncbi:MAG: class I SAM-dependent methyltransferase [Gammaproteobacteria bacterium]|nr:class I SAM-dependent methyltransferase [Gammaproteobacteria bacterium]